MTDTETRYVRLTEMIEDEARALLGDERANLPTGAEFWFASADMAGGELKIVAFWRAGDVRGHVHRTKSGKVLHHLNTDSAPSAANGWPL